MYTHMYTCTQSYVYTYIFVIMCLCLSVVDVCVCVCICNVLGQWGLLILANVGTYMNIIPTGIYRPSHLFVMN